MTPCKTGRYRRLNLNALLLITLLLGPHAALAKSEPEDLASLYEEALIQFNREEMPTAIIHLKNILQKDPNFLSAHLLLGKAYLQQGDGAGAEKEFLIADRLGVDRGLIIIPLAQAYLDQEKYQKLLNELDIDGFTSRTQAELLVLRGQAYRQLNRLPEAEQAFEEASQIAPDNVDAVLGLADISLRHSDFSTAEERIARAIKLAPEEAGVWHLAGSIKHAQRDNEGAVAHYSKAIELEPKHLAARMARAGVRMDQGFDAEALKDIVYLREAYPKDPRAAYLHAVLLARGNDEAGSRKALLEAVAIIDGLNEQLFTKHGPSLLLAGLVHYSLNQWEKARQYLKRYIKLEPQHAHARKLLGSILLSKGEHKRAITVLEPALEFAANDPRLLTLLGTAYTRAKRHLKATEVLSKAMRLAPNEPTASFQYALNNLATGEDMAAMEGLASVFDSSEEANKAGLILAVLHFQRQEFAAARDVANKILKRDQGNLTVLNLLASTQMALKEWDAARSGFEKIVATNPDYLPARINLGKLDLLEGKKVEAQRRLQGILKEHPEHIRTLIELARVAEASGEPEEAIRWLKKARSINAEAIPVVLYLVDLYLRNGKPEAALKTAQEADQIMPDKLEILHAVGRSQMATNHLVGARLIYKRMTRIASYDTGWLYRIAQMQRRLGDLGNAIWSLQKAVDGDAGFVPAQVMLVESQLQAGKLKKAREGALDLRSRYPDQPFGYWLLGEVQLRDGEHLEAIDNYQQALQREQTPRLAIGLYQAYMRSGEEARAMAFLKQWLKSHPEDMISKQALAEGYLRKGRIAQARPLFEQILKNRPDHPLVLNNLANIYLKTGDARALEYALKAHQLASDSAAINDTLGWILVLNDQPAEGLRHLRNAHSRASADPEIRYHIGVALERLGRLEEAKTELEQALGANQPFDGMEEAQAVLEELSNPEVN